LFDLAHAAGLPLVELDGARWRSTGGQPARPDEQRLLEDVLGQLPDLGPGEDQNFQSFLASRPADAGSRLARAWVESYDAADAARLSVRALLRERQAERLIDGDRAFRLVTGYDGVPATLLAGIAPERGSVRLASIVTDVHWSPGAVRVETRAASDGARAAFNARRLVVALPLGVLQAPENEPGAVRFWPPLTDKTVALGALQMGPVVKIVFAFKERFWARSLSDQLGFLMSDDDQFRAWWTGYPVYAPVLVAWAGGPAAAALGDLSVHQRVDRALDVFARLAHVPRAVVEDQIGVWAAHDWAADPFARGAYSYVCVGGIEAQAALAEPVQDTLFFAGEATELRGYQATVHGALFAGERAADEVVASLR
jgi:monoamine oxidase